MVLLVEIYFYYIKGKKKVKIERKNIEIFVKDDIMKIQKVREIGHLRHIWFEYTHSVGGKNYVKIKNCNYR